MASMRSCVFRGILLFAVACSSRHSSDTQSLPASGAPQPPPAAPEAPPAALEARAWKAMAAPYPRGAWRLAKSADLEKTVLWFSQILVRHAAARDSVSFVLGFWASVPPPAQRSREEAFALANEIADKAAKDPRQFAELARRYSEDLPRSDEGGAVGGYPTSVFTLWPGVLDALAALRPGQTSRVVETRYGFHILCRSAPPPEQITSGEHILIGHTQAPWGQVFARDDRQPTRSREQALALANEVYRDARAEPSRWGELVRQYSEHSDVVLGGDFGAWSTREPSAYPARMKRLRELALGEVGAPIETHLGFEIVRRTPSGPRQQYRARMLMFPFDEVDSQAPRENASARATALASARAAAKIVAADPARFDELGPTRVQQWQSGQELPALSVAFQQLEIGQFTPAPVTSEYGFLIAQRLAPEAGQPPRYTTELPAPSEPDVPHLFHDLSASEGAAFLSSLATEAQQLLGLADPVAPRLRALHEQGRRLDDNMPTTRLGILNEIFDGTRELLGDELFARYRELLNRRAVAVLLGPAPDPRMDLGF
jgi:hypothetical protein